jgi:hypothetical protein
LLRGLIFLDKVAVTYIYGIYGKVTAAVMTTVIVS